MVELLKQAKQKYKNKDVVKCLSDDYKYILDSNTIHIDGDMIWAYDKFNFAIKLYNDNKWAKIITRKQNIYELW